MSPFIFRAVDVYRSGGVCMVEAAGVEPHCAVHLFVFIVLYQHLMTFPKSEEMQIDAAKCS